MGNVRGEIKGNGAVCTFLVGDGSLGGGRRAKPTLPGCGAPGPGRGLQWVRRGAGGAKLQSPDARWACRCGGLGSTALWGPVAGVPELGPTPGPGAASRADWV